MGQPVLPPLPSSICVLNGGAIFTVKVTVLEPVGRAISKDDGGSADPVCLAVVIQIAKAAVRKPKRFGSSADWLRDERSLHAGI